VIYFATCPVATLHCLDLKMLRFPNTDGTAPGYILSHIEKDWYPVNKDGKKIWLFTFHSGWPCLHGL